MVKAQSIENLAGQRLMLGFDGRALDSGLKTMIKDFRAGGIILFRYNVESHSQVRTLCTEAQAYAQSCGLPPLFIAIDQEGGVVARLRHPFREFPGNPHIHTPDQARAFARDCGQDLLDLGINMNLAPVLDVVPEGMPSIMKERAFPGDAGQVAELGTEVITTFQDAGLMAVAKHFPGIGSTVKDSHLTLPVMAADRQALEARDLIPFRAAIRAGVAGVMLSHISYPALDKEWQASLSTVIARDLVRRDLGYQGLVLTDDLDMKAISLDMDTCMKRVLEAEVDLALICHTGPGIQQGYDALCRYLETDPGLKERAERSFGRIMAAKTRFL